MNYNQIKSTLRNIAYECDKLPNKTELGEKAMELIGDYPLYVGGLSNISYGEAIAIAVLIYGDIDSALRESQESDQLMAEYFKTDRKHSIADYDKWVAEKKGEQ